MKLDIVVDTTIDKEIYISIVNKGGIQILNINIDDIFSFVNDMGKAKDIQKKIDSLIKEIFER